VRTVLVSLKHADGTAAVFRDDEEGFGRFDAWLTGRLEDGGGTALASGAPEIEDLRGDRVVAGGLLPAGAAGAIVVDVAGRERRAAAGQGAWIAVVEEPSHDPPPVRFVDAAGEVVPLPHAGARRPVEDADEPCRACGAPRWQLVEDEAIVCERCGHTISSSAWPSVSLDAAARAARDAQWHAGRRARWALGALAFRPVGLPDWPGERSLGGWAALDNTVTMVRLRYRGADGSVLDVGTGGPSREHGSPVAVARDGLAVGLWDAATPPARSDAGAQVWWATHEAACRRRAWTAPAEPLTVHVDGRPEELTLVRAGQTWVAAGYRDAVLLTLAGKRLDPSGLRLARVDDAVAHVFG
jgi:hypothetical protein